jgi:ribosomal protein S27AE
MRNSKNCPKCKAATIIRIPADRMRGGHSWIFLGMLGGWNAVGVTRYLCGSCGYIEHWVDDPDDVAKVKKVYSS